MNAHVIMDNGYLVAKSKDPRLSERDLYIMLVGYARGIPLETSGTIIRCNNNTYKLKIKE